MEAAKVRRKRKKTEEHFFDYTLLFIVLFLLGFGLVMLYSTSSYEASLNLNDGSYYLKKQATATLLGLIAMTIVALIPYGFWERFATIGYFASIFAIFLVKSPLGYSSGGATRWFKVFGLSVQPAEIAKITIILFLASFICKMGKAINSWKGFGVIIAIPLPISLLIYVLTNNLSSAIIILGIAVVMLFVATTDYKKFVLLGLAGAAMVAVVIFFIVNQQADGMGFRGERILAWLDPEAHASGKGFQTLQALYAIGSGGLFGKGLGQSMQKLGFIPEAQNDMIFSIICEELGLFGAVSILLLFMILLWRCVVIANNASNMFGSMLVVGVMGHLSIQVILNIAVVTNTIPNTGITLPFISFGGSSVLFLLSEIGLVLSVSRGISLKES